MKKTLSTYTQTQKITIIFNQLKVNKKLVVKFTTFNQRWRKKGTKVELHYTMYTYNIRKKYI